MLILLTLPLDQAMAVINVHPVVGSHVYTLFQVHYYIHSRTHLADLGLVSNLHLNLDHTSNVIGAELLNLQNLHRQGHYQGTSMRRYLHPSLTNNFTQRRYDPVAEAQERRRLATLLSPPPSVIQQASELYDTVMARIQATGNNTVPADVVSSIDNFFNLAALQNQNRQNQVDPPQRDESSMRPPSEYSSPSKWIEKWTEEDLQVFSKFMASQKASR